MRPEYQAPDEVRTQLSITGITEQEETIVTFTEPKTWPKQAKDQLAAIRDLLRTTGGE